MKYFILAFATLVQLTANAQSRLVLYEEFTSETCPPSRILDSLLWERLRSGSNPANIQLITFVTPYPSQGFLYKSNQSEYYTRSNYYGVPFVSIGYIDGETHDTSATSKGRPDHHQQPVLDEEIAVPARFNLLLACTQNTTGDSLSADVLISCLADFAPPGARLKLYAAFIRTLDYTTPPGSNGQTHFENMVRKMYPSPSGILLDSAWTTGDIHNVHISGIIPAETADSALHPHTSSPGILVVWLQNDNGKIVEQCARAAPVTIPTTSMAPPMQCALATLYPNPASKQLTILPGLDCSPPYNILVSDVLGRMMYQRVISLPGATVINTAHYPPGYYTVILQSGDRRQNAMFQKAD